MAIKTNALIGTVLSLKRQQHSDRALDILMQAANLVHPIMKKRNWTVKTMREFLPKDPMLLGLNVNKGLEVRIRLRPHHSPNSFYPFDDILGTVLHELVHNRISPHNDAFNALLDELWREVDDLRAAGLTGQGARVGVRNAADAKKAAADAAERRLKLGLCNGGQRLGGSRARRPDGLTPREAAAQAALRRHMDATKCGNGHGVVEEEDDEVEFVGETRAQGVGEMVVKTEHVRPTMAGPSRKLPVMAFPAHDAQGSRKAVAHTVPVVVLSDDDVDEAGSRIEPTKGSSGYELTRKILHGDDDDDDDVVLVAVRGNRT